MSGTTNRTHETFAPESYQGQVLQLLSNIIAVQKKHSVLLTEIHHAATRPIEGTNPVATALNALVTSTNNQTHALGSLIATMQDLPSQISAGMRSEIDLALNDL